MTTHGIPTTGLIQQLNRGSIGTPLFLIHPITGAAYGSTYMNLIRPWRHLDNPIYAINHYEMIEHSSTFLTIDELADLYVEAINEEIGTTTTITILGWSFGGNVVAALLDKLEGRLHNAIIIDSVNDNLENISSQEFFKQIKEIFDIITDALQAELNICWEFDYNNSKKELLYELEKRVAGETDIPDFLSNLLFGTIKNYYAVLTIDTKPRSKWIHELSVFESDENKGKLFSMWSTVAEKVTVYSVPNTSHMTIIDSPLLPEKVLPLIV